MITVKHFTECDAPGCATMYTYEYKWKSDNRPAYPVLPDGWQQIGDKTFCPRHKIEIVVNVDGERFADV